jgi:hypothetical protein
MVRITGSCFIATLRRRKKRSAVQTSYVSGFVEPMPPEIAYPQREAYGVLRDLQTPWIRRRQTDAAPLGPAQQHTTGV